MALIAASSAAIGCLTVDAIISGIGRLSCWHKLGNIIKRLGQFAQLVCGIGPIPLTPGEPEFDVTRLDEGGRQLAEPGW